MLWIFMILAVTHLTDSRIFSYKHYSYIQNIGIPAAKCRLEFENRIIKQSSGISSRIIGGFQAHHENHPWLVNYNLSKKAYKAWVFDSSSRRSVGLLVHISLNVSMCGGSLLSRNRVLTAGHCWYDLKTKLIPEMMEVVLGSSFLYYGGTRLKTKRVIVHPKWVSDIPDEVDAAIAILPKDVTYSSNIQPIALPEDYRGETFAGWTTYGVGYGLIHDDPINIRPDINKAVYLKVMSKKYCNPGINLLCTSGKGKKGICSGDSGGPLSIYHNGRNILVGIMSMTMTNDCETGYPSLHVRVNKILDWIKQHLEYYATKTTPQPRKKLLYYLYYLFNFITL